MSEYNSEIVAKTLRTTVNILEKNKIEYRFLGSVVLAAIHGKLHRNLGDLDLIIDISGKDILYDESTKIGYQRKFGISSIGRKYLSLETLDSRSKDLLEVGYFYGRFKKDGSFIMSNDYLEFYVDAYAVKDTQYTLYGMSFSGLPTRTIARGIKTSESNPKRKKELEILRKKKITPFPNSYIHVRVFGMKADFLYHTVMIFLNILGFVRVRLGLAYDPWR